MPTGAESTGSSSSHWVNSLALEVPIVASTKLTILNLLVHVDVCMYPLCNNFTFIFHFYKLIFLFLFWTVWHLLLLIDNGFSGNLLLFTRAHFYCLWVIRKDINPFASVVTPSLLTLQGGSLSPVMQWESVSANAVINCCNFNDSLMKFISQLFL